MELSADLIRYRTDPIIVEPLDHMSAVTSEAYTELTAASDQLAALSIERRQLVRQTGSHAEQLRTDFLDARARYSMAFEATADIYVTNMRTQGAGDLQIREAVVPYIVGLHSQLTNKEASLAEQPGSQKPRFSPLLAQVHEQASARAAEDSARLKQRTEELVASNHTPEAAVHLITRYFDALLADRIAADQASTYKRARSATGLGAIATVAAAKLRRNKKDTAVIA